MQEGLQQLFCKLASPQEWVEILNEIDYNYTQLVLMNEGKDVEVSAVASHRFYLKEMKEVLSRV